MLTSASRTGASQLDYTFRHVTRGTPMKPGDIVREIYQAAVEIPEPFASLSEDEKKSANKLMTRFEQAEARYGTLPHGELLRPMLLSKNGRYEEALALTEQSYQQAPNWETAVSRNLVR